MSGKQHQNDHNEDDIVFEEEELSEAGSTKRLRDKLKTCVAEKQEYLEGQPN